MRIAAVLLFSFLVGLGLWTAPDKEAASISSQFAVGDRTTNLLYTVGTRGFDVVKFDKDKARYVRGDKRGQQIEFFGRYSYPYIDKIENVCQGKNCIFFGAKRIDRPFGARFKFSHVYKIGWVERDGILQAVGAENRTYYYPLK